MTLLLLHGLGATGAVWHDWQGIAPDLPGHGGADWVAPYSFTGHAEALLPLAANEPVDVIGHSMGGVVGLALAVMAPGRIRSVVGVGIKVAWSADDVTRVASLATRPPAWFESEGDALDRFLKVSGLAGIVGPGDPRTGRGVVEEGGRWRLAQDPATFGVGVPDMRGLLAAVECPVVLARGEHDPMVTETDLGALVPSPVELPGLGHNAHVEDPDAVHALVGHDSGGTGVNTMQP